MNPENSTTALVKTTQSLTLARVSNQLALTDKLLIKPEEPFLIPYRKGNKWGFCDRNKNIVIDCIYDIAWPFVSTYAQVKYNDEEGLVDRKGDFLRKKNVDQDVYDNSYWAVNVKSCKILDNTKANLPAGCNKYVRFTQSEIDIEYYAVNCGDKWGFVNKSGQEVIPFIYDMVLPFSEGLAGVCINQEWKFIDKAGTKLIKQAGKKFGIFSEVVSFSQGLAAVMQICEGQARWGHINHQGNFLHNTNYEGYWACPYTRAETFNNGLAFVEIIDVNDEDPWSGLYITGYIDVNAKEYWDEWFPWKTYPGWVWH